MSSKTGRYRPKAVKTRSPRKVIAIAIAALAVVIAVAAAVSQALQPKNYELRQGTILTMDSASRTGKVEYIHPKTGKTMQTEAEVPADCLIKIDGRPAELRDVRLGDKFSASIMIYPSITGSARIVAREVRVARSPATQPASGPLPAPSSAPAAPGTAMSKSASGT